MRNVKEALAYLGTKRRDVVTGVTGVITSVSFDINGCIQGCLRPGVDKEGKIPEGYWIDLVRLLDAGGSVMEPFPFDIDRSHIAGSAEKPAK